MTKLHKKKEKNTQIVTKESQSDFNFLCSNKESYHSPSLGYIKSEIENTTGIDKAFDILFEAVLNNRKKIYETNKINSNIRQSFDV